MILSTKKVQEKNIDETLEQWLMSYKQSSDTNERAKLKTLIVTAMMSKVRKIATTIARRDYDPVDDLVQAGAIGLIKAIENFKPELSKSFRIYAGYLIIGEMRHYIRDKMSLIRVPREIQELAYRINSFVTDVSDDYIDNLTQQDIAEALNVPVKKVGYAMEMDRRKKTVSLDHIYDKHDQNISFEEIIGTDDYKFTAETYDQKIILNEVIEKLPDDLKELIYLYYHEDLSQKQIAERTNLSPMMVSRKLKKAFDILYSLITSEKRKV